MHLSSGRILALSSLLVVGASSLALGQENPRPDGEKGLRPRAAPATPVAEGSSALTGKERLGDKWTDEQRVDNCNVPPDRRGQRPRPDACQNIPTQ
jgi:hypothetical protein